MSEIVNAGENMCNSTETVVTSTSPNFGKIRLIVLDMDGTALNSHHQFSQNTIDALRKYSSMGVIVAFATGRSSLNVLPFLETLQLPQESVPVICFNGSIGLLVRLNGETSSLFAKPLPRIGARRLIDFAKAKGHLVQFYDGATGTVYSVPSSPTHHELLGRYAALVGRKQTQLENFDEVVKNIEPAKVLLLTEDVDQLIEDCKREAFHDEFHVIRGSPEPTYFVEFLLPNVNKGTALVELSQALDIPLSEIIAFGDGDNDMEMLASGCRGVAMLNSLERVKAVAVEVTQFSNNEDGVARHLELLEGLGCFVSE